MYDTCFVFNENRNEKCNTSNDMKYKDWPSPSNAVNRCKSVWVRVMTTTNIMTK